MVMLITIVIIFAIGIAYSIVAGSLAQRLIESYDTIEKCLSREEIEFLINMNNLDSGSPVVFDVEKRQDLMQSLRGKGLVAVMDGADWAQLTKVGKYMARHIDEKRHKK